MDPIGGFFGIELPRLGSAGGYHPDAIGLTTGRACLALALQEIRPTVCHVPFYSCDSLLTPVRIAGCDLAFYEINEELEPEEVPELGAGELFIYTNFFGLKNRYAESLSSTLGTQVLIDNTHQFFRRGYPNSYSFTSARKYFGVPDGAYLYPPRGTAFEGIYERNNAVSTEHLFARLLGRDDLALALYRESEARLGSDVLGMSLVSERLLAAVDYQAVIERRQDNYDFLADNLGESNCFALKNREGAVPFCYPYLPDPPIAHERFFAERLYPPRLWPDPLARTDPGYAVSRRLCRDLLPLPVDHRYDSEDLSRMVAFIRSELKA